MARLVMERALYSARLEQGRSAVGVAQDQLDVGVEGVSFSQGRHSELGSEMGDVGQHLVGHGRDEICGWIGGRLNWDRLQVSRGVELELRPQSGPEGGGARRGAGGATRGGGGRGARACARAGRRRGRFGGTWGSRWARRRTRARGWRSGFRGRYGRHDHDRLIGWARVQVTVDYRLPIAGQTAPVGPNPCLLYTSD